MRGAWNTPLGYPGLAGYTWFLSKQLLKGQLCETVMPPEGWRTVTVICGTLQQGAHSWCTQGSTSLENEDNLKMPWELTVAQSSGAFLLISHIIHFFLGLGLALNIFLPLIFLVIYFCLVLQSRTVNRLEEK